MELPLAINHSVDVVPVLAVVLLFRVDGLLSLDGVGLANRRQRLAAGRGGADSKG